MKNKITEEVLEMFDNRIGTAIDLGCGEGFDSIYLLENNWNVIAIDLFTESIKKNSKKLDEKYKNKLIIRRQEFENLDIPRVDLILANYSISYCKKERLISMLNKVVNSIKINGKLAGIIYGENDYRKEYTNCLTKENIYNILEEKFEIESFKEYEDIRNINNSLKNEHSYEIIARKIKD